MTGPTGEYPRGKIASDDGGAVDLDIKSLNGQLVLEFGTPVLWIGMETARARHLAAMIIIAADRIDAKSKACAVTDADLAIATCPSCLRRFITMAHVEQTWPYGDAREPDKQVTLSATVPQYSCAACGFTWTDHVAEEIREATVRRHLAQSRPTVRIHVLEDRFALCRFSDKAPGQWPFGEIWIRRDIYEDTRAACADPGHDLHCVFRHVMCEVCERVLNATDDLPPIPVHPTEGRTCERCGVALDPDHTAVYCTNECALADAHDGPSVESMAEMTASSTSDALRRRLMERLMRSDFRRPEQWLGMIQTALLAAELKGAISEFYALCIQALLAVATSDAHSWPEAASTAATYMSMAEAVASTEFERHIVNTYARLTSKDRT
jgi:hypothetical protein